MRTQWFEVELLSDVVVSSRGATAGSHRSLDYLPGSAFLGLAASGGFDPGLLWSGSVVLGDAYPLSSGGEIAFPVPFSYHLPKGTEEGDGAVPEDGTSGLPGKEQRRQLREGYFTPPGTMVRVEKTFRIKTAIDRDRGGRAKDNQLFGYEAIKAGRRYAMCLHAGPAVAPEAFDEVVKRLEGEKRLGRSRSAEYGRVRITRRDGAVPLPAPEPRGNRVCFYLLSDLALSTNGCPRLLPRAGDFGLEGGKFEAGFSFLRTRRYSPWNYFYNSRLTERQVISRGSVITFEADLAPDTDRLKALAEGLLPGVGDYREDGLGRVLVNPAFLFAPPALLKDAVGPAASADVPGEPPAGKLAAHLRRRREERSLQLEAVKKGRALADEWYAIHRKANHPPSKTQWSKVRAICAADPAASGNLREEIQEFFGADKSRKRFWREKIEISGKTVTMLNAVVNKLGGSEEEPPASGSREARLLRWSLFYAAVEMTRRIQEQSKGKGGRK